MTIVLEYGASLSLTSAAVYDMFKTATAAFNFKPAIVPVLLSIVEYTGGNPVTFSGDLTTIIQQIRTQVSVFLSREEGCSHIFNSCLCQPFCPLTGLFGSFIFVVSFVSSFLYISPVSLFSPYFLAFFSLSLCFFRKEFSLCIFLSLYLSSVACSVRLHQLNSVQQTM